MLWAIDMLNRMKMKSFFKDATSLNGYSLSQPLKFDENKLERNVCLEDNLKNPDVSVIA